MDLLPQPNTHHVLSLDLHAQVPRFSREGYAARSRQTSKSHLFCVVTCHHYLPSPFNLAIVPQSSCPQGERQTADVSLPVLLLSCRNAIYNRTSTGTPRASDWLHPCAPQPWPTTGQASMSEMGYIHLHFSLNFSNFNSLSEVDRAWILWSISSCTEHEMFFFTLSPFAVFGEFQEKGVAVNSLMPILRPFSPSFLTKTLILFVFPILKICPCSL